MQQAYTNNPQKSLFAPSSWQLREVLSQTGPVTEESSILSFHPELWEVNQKASKGGEVTSSESKSRMQNSV